MRNGLRRKTGEDGIEIYQLEKYKMSKYYLTNHICRNCKTGRILQQVSKGPSGGGGSLYVCSLCGYEKFGIALYCMCGIDKDQYSPIESICVDMSTDRINIERQLLSQGFNRECYYPQRQVEVWRRKVKSPD